MPEAPGGFSARRRPRSGGRHGAGPRFATECCPATQADGTPQAATYLLAVVRGEGDTRFHEEGQDHPFGADI